MRNVVLAMFTSLDGYIEGPGRKMVPPPYSADLQRYWIDRNMERAGTMAYGRVAYEMMAAYWTSPAAQDEQAAQLAEMDKLVLSRTLPSADWGRVRILRDGIAAEIQKLKQQDGKDIVLIGGAGLANTFLGLGLVDEMTILVSPVLLGGGTRLFQEGYGRTALQLAETRPFDTGALLLTYRKP